MRRVNSGDDYRLSGHHKTSAQHKVLRNINSKLACPQRAVTSRRSWKYNGLLTI